MSDPEMMPVSYRQPFGLRVDEQAEQIISQNRFQQLSPDWSKTKTTTAYDLESVETIPISLVVAMEDTACGVEQADLLASRLATLKSYTKIEGVDHEFFFDGNSDELVDLYVSEIGTTVKINKFDLQGQTTSDPAEEEGSVEKTCVFRESDEVEDDEDDDMGVIGAIIAGAVLLIVAVVIILVATKLCKRKFKCARIV